MGSKTETFDLLSGIKNKNTPLLLTLYGFRQSLGNHIGIKNIPLVSHDNHKAVLRREHGSSYPYAYFKLNSFEIVRDDQVVKNIRRHASAISLDDLTNSTLTKGFLFPTKLSIEFHWVHSNILDVIQYIEKSAILGAVDGFSFQVNIPGIKSDWTASVDMDSGPITIPQAALEDSNEPGGMDIVSNFTIRTKTGIVKEVPKINNEGIVQRSVGVLNTNTGELES